MIAYWIKAIFFILAGLGTLLFGFELLSTNITKLFHSGLKKLFNKTAKNDLIGVGIGTASTAIMQSSAATTIMVVGFVNTGIMTLRQAAAIIMGANIGTTITAQLVALSGFDFGAYAIGLAGIGVIIDMFAKKEKIKSIAKALAGFGLIFLGLECVSLAIGFEYEGVAVIRESISTLLQNIDGGFAPALLFVLGIVLTAAVQSSSLITTVIISLSSVGIYIGSGGNSCLTNNVLYLILGTNIGTCVTALISSFGANYNAKRASLIHLLFNTFGALVFIILLILWPTFMQDTFGSWFKLPETQIAMFHTAFNVICTIIFLPFIGLFVKISEIVIVEKAEPAETLSFIDSRLIQSPSVAIHMARKELEQIYVRAYNNLDHSLDGFFEKNPTLKNEIDEQNASIANACSQVQAYIVKLTNEELAYEDECTISAFHKVLHDIVRIGEIGDNICKYTIQIAEQNLEFSESIMPQLALMRQSIKRAFEKTDEIFLTKNLSKLPEADALEDTIDKMRKELVEDHFDRLNRGECKPQNSGVFVNLVNNMERAADHMSFIAHSVEEAYNQSHKKDI